MGGRGRDHRAHPHGQSCPAGPGAVREAPSEGSRGEGGHFINIDRSRSDDIASHTVREKVGKIAVLWRPREDTADD